MNYIMLMTEPHAEPAAEAVGNNFGHSESVVETQINHVTPIPDTSSLFIFQSTNRCVIAAGFISM